MHRAVGPARNNCGVNAGKLAAHRSRLDVRILQDERVTVWYTAPTAIRMLMKTNDEVVRKYDKGFRYNIGRDSVRHASPQRMHSSKMLDANRLSERLTLPVRTQRERDQQPSNVVDAEFTNASDGGGSATVNEEEPPL